MDTRFVYFDVGGVIIQDFSASNKWSELKNELGITPEKNDAFESLWQQYEWEICLHRDVESLVPILNKELQLTLPASFSLLNAFVNRFESNPNINTALHFLREHGYRIGLLTNMYPKMLESIRQKNILPSVPFEVIVDSSEVGWQKPQHEIFHLAQKMANIVKPEEIFFIDNSLTHIAAAQACGWQTYYFDSADYAQSSELLFNTLSSIAPAVETDLPQ